MGVASLFDDYHQLEIIVRTQYILQRAVTKFPTSFLTFVRVKPAAAASLKKPEHEQDPKLDCNIIMSIDNDYNVVLRKSKTKIMSPRGSKQATPENRNNSAESSDSLFTD